MVHGLTAVTADVDHEPGFAGDVGRTEDRPSRPRAPKRPPARVGAAELVNDDAWAWSIVTSHIPALTWAAVSSTPLRCLTQDASMPSWGEKK